MTALETAVEWLRDMRRVAGPHCEYATTLLDRLYDCEMYEQAVDTFVEALERRDDGPDVSLVDRAQNLMVYHEAVEARLEAAGVLDPDRQASDTYDVDGLLAMFLPDAT